MAAARPASQSTCTRQWQPRCQHQRARRQTSLRRRNGKNNSAHAGAIFLQGAGNHADRPVGPPGRESDPSRNVYGRDRTNTLNRAPGRPRSGGYPALAWGAQPLTRVVPSQELHRWSRQACSHNNAPPRISAHPSRVSCHPARELRLSSSSSSSWSQRVFSRG